MYVTKHVFIPTEQLDYLPNLFEKPVLCLFQQHSCSPNLYVQNVFVDTHDLRFPWVAFFTQQ